MNINKKHVTDIQMENIFDIVQLIERNPITRLNKDYQDKLLQKIKTNFTEPQQQLLVASMICYLNYNSKIDFIIDLDLIWKWLGYDRKSFCKTLLLKHFTQDIDYIIKKVKNEIIIQKDKIQLASAAAEASSIPHKICEETILLHLQQNKNNEETRCRKAEQILMNIHTFKKLCLKSNTKKADEVHDYFIKLE